MHLSLLPFPLVQVRESLALGDGRGPVVVEDGVGLGKPCPVGWSDDFAAHACALLSSPGEELKNIID